MEADQVTDNGNESRIEAQNRLLVEIEMGQQALPKPLLSGYFTNALNSVRVVNEVQRSLEDHDILPVDCKGLPDI